MLDNLQINVIASQACKNRIDNIKKTWGQHFTDIIYYADFEEASDIIKCTENPTSVGNEEKLLKRLVQIKQKNTYNWYFFVDDDTFINSNNLYNFIKVADNTKTYGRLIHGWGINYFQGGAGVLISKQLIDLIPLQILYLRNSTFSDVLFGQIMVDAGIKMFHEETFYDRSPQSYKLSSEQIKTAITFHQVADTMLELYEQIYKN